MALQLNIPASAFESKIWFEKRPASEVVRQIKDFIQSTGCPHLWPGHTHSLPPKGARVVYIGTFDLPKSYRSPDRWAPCPCCSPHHPKYFRDGMIAWFPDEGVVRNIGRDCFAALNPEGHWEALAQFKAEEAESLTIAYLLKSLPIVPAAINVIDRALPTVRAVDALRSDMACRVEQLLHVKLWPYMRDGKLKVTVRRDVTTRHRDGSEVRRTIDDFEDYAVLPGYKIFRPNPHLLSTRLQNWLKRLQFINFGEELDQRVREMSKSDKAKAARMLSNGISAANAVFSEVEALRGFFRPEATATLKGWTKHPGCPVKLWFSANDTAFLVGAEEHSYISFPYPHAFWNVIGKLPQLSITRKAA